MLWIEGKVLADAPFRVVHFSQIVIRDAAEEISFRVSKGRQSIQLIGKPDRVFPVLLAGADVSQSVVRLRILGIGCNRLVVVLGCILKLFVALVNQAEQSPGRREFWILRYRLV